MHSPPALLDDTKSTLESFQWDHLTANDQDPLNILYDRYVNNHAPGTLKTIEAIYLGEEFQGKIIEIICANEDQLGQWVKFAKVFQRYSQSVEPSFNKTRLLIICKGRPSNSIRDASTVEEVLLDVMKWDGYGRRIDGLLASATSLLSRSQYSLDENVLERDLIESISSEIALWDDQLAAHLANKSISKLFEPLELLKEYAKDMGMSCSSSDDRNDAWSDGLLHNIDGREEWHSCALAAKDKKFEIERRVWKGQLSVILPYLEIERTILIENFKSKLTIPHRDKEGKIRATSWEELELGHISFQLKQRQDEINKIDRKILPAIKKFTETRNNLAHFKPIKSIAIEQGLLKTLKSPPWNRKSGWSPLS
jgi:hypothetical protein